MLVFWIFVLAILTPCVSFCSVNTQFFTQKQIVLSILLSLLAGCAAGACAWFYAGVLGRPWQESMLMLAAWLCFVLLSERFFTETFQDRCVRWSVMAAGACVFCLAGYFAWNIFVLSLLALYGCFAFYDLLKNWSRPKTPVFASEETIAKTSGQKHVRFVKKPNVYLMLLESMHSSEALKRIYGVHTERAEYILQKNNFTIYPDTFSNKHSTPLSLRTILSLSLDYNARPDVLENFISNGYKCNFFDTMAYLAQPYIKYISNAKLSRIAVLAYSLFAPLFSQSAWLRIIVGGIDPFKTDTASREFEAMRADFCTALAAENIVPTFNILHFGSQHFGDLWYRIKSPQKIYMQNYNCAARDLELIVSDIVSADPEAIIIAVGDHGAYHWNGAQGGSRSPEQNLKAHGVAAEALVYDFFGIILGIRWGSLSQPQISDPISPVNIFRWVFTALEGRAKPREMEENISILDGNYIVARNGKTLEQFEPLTNIAYSDYYPLLISDTELFEETVETEAKLERRQISGLASDTGHLFKTAMKSTPVSLQHFNAVKVMFAAGDISNGLKLLDYCWEEKGLSLGYEPFSYLVRAHIGIKNYERAKDIISKVQAVPHFPQRNAYLYLMIILWREKRYEEMMSIVSRIFDIKRDLICEPVDKFPIESTFSHMAIEKLHGAAKAMEWLENSLVKEKDNAAHLYSLFVQKIVFLLRYNSDKAISELRKRITGDNTPPGFIILYLRLLIINGKMDIAKKIIEENNLMDSMKKNFSFMLLLEDIYKKGTKENVLAIQTKISLVKEIENSRLFDPDWYANKYKLVTPSPLLFDYVKNGVALLRNPNKSFDLYFYLCAYPPVLLQGLDPLLHYISLDKSIPPSPEIDRFFYISAHPLFKNKFL